MTSLVSFLLQGAGLGFSASISPGPLLAYLVSQSLTGSWKRGAIVALAPLVSDIPLVILITLLLDEVPELFLSLVSFAGGLYLIFLAWRLFRSWRSSSDLSTPRPSKIYRNFLQAVLINLTSPSPYLFWSLVNGPLLLAALRISIIHGVVFILSFYIAFIGCMLIIAGIFAQARRLGPRIVHIFSLVSVIILGIFGLALIYRGLVSVISIK